MLSNPSGKYSLGLMSGTSLDGVDAALLASDGEDITQFGPWLTLPYPPQFRTELAQTIQDFRKVPEVEDRLTRYHAEAVKQLLEREGLTPNDIRLVGFHGQTILHKPEQGLTWQIGNGSLLAELTGCDVIADFRRADMAAGGQGAPLVPVFHRALAGWLECPAVLVNIGGIANITYVAGRDHESALWGCDTGPGNRLIDRWVQMKTGIAYDAEGEIGLRGTVDETVLKQLMSDPAIHQPMPKSFDTADFNLDPVLHLSLEDGAATLAAFTADAIALNIEHMPQAPRQWVMCGGGRLNKAIMARLKQSLASTQPVIMPIDDAGISGDALEAYAFAYLAERSVRGLPLTFPNTTGVSRAVTGGAFYRAAGSAR
jgi:anhydro-N-acetylmuramic acid kinase